MTFRQTDSNKLMEAYSFHRLLDVMDESRSCSSPLPVCLDCLSHALLTKDKASLSGKLSPHALAGEGNDYISSQLSLAVL